MIISTMKQQLSMDTLKEIVSEVLELFPFTCVEHYPMGGFDFIFVPATCLSTCRVETYSSSFVFSWDGVHAGFDDECELEADSVLFDSQTFSSLWDRLTAYATESGWDFETYLSTKKTSLVFRGEGPKKIICKIITTMLEHRDLGIFL